MILSHNKFKEGASTTDPEVGGIAWEAAAEYKEGDIVYDISDDTPYVAINTPVSDLTTIPSQNLTEWKAITGTSGSMLTADYRFATTTTGDPGVGKGACNHSDNTLATVLFINDLDEDNIDRTYGLETLKHGDYVNFRDKGNDPDTYIYRVNGTAIDHGTYFEIPVVHHTSVGAGGLSDNERMNIEVLYIPVTIPERGGVYYDGTVDYTNGDIVSYQSGPGMPYVAYTCIFGTTGTFDPAHWEAIGSGSTFLELTDTPADYTGQAGKVLKVNTAEDALVMVDEYKGTYEHSDLTTYAVSDQMWMVDPDRSTFKTTYVNASGSDNLGVFDPLEWTQIYSAADEAYALDTAQTGLLSGGIITQTAATQITVSAGSGVIVNTVDITAPVTQKVDFLQQDITLPNIDVDSYWIFIENTGNIITVTSKPTNGFFTTHVYLGFVAVDFINAGEIGLISNRPVTTQSLSKSVLGAFRYFAGTSVVSGGALSGVAGTRGLAVDPAEIYGYNINYRTDPANPDIIVTMGQSPLTFNYLDSAGNQVSIGSTVIDPSNYDDAGTPTSVNNDDATIQLVFYSPLNGEFYVLYGQEKYKDLQDAINNKINYAAGVTVPPKVQEVMMRVGYVIVQADCTDITDTDFAIVETTEGSSASGSGTVPTELGDLTDVVLTPPATGEVLTYNSVSGVWENVLPAGAFAVNEVAHGHSVLGPVRITPTGWERGKADTLASLPDALVINVVDADNFVVATSGIQTIPTHGKTVASTYYTSDTASGTTTTTAPTTSGRYVHEAYLVLDANTVSIGTFIAQEI